MGDNNTIENCINRVNVEAENIAGGIANSYVSLNLNNIIKNCKNYGEIKSKGTMWARTGAGGISGTINGAEILDCENYGKIISNANSGGIIGSRRKYEN